jgi:branched-chain amino acid transport system substrate-binding protein
MITRRVVLAGASLLGIQGARAEEAPVIRIGVLNDQSSTYRDNGGMGSVACVKLAVAESAAQLGLKAEVVSADHQNKPDIAMGIARQWLDEGVDAICDIQNSSIALAVSDLVRQRDKILLAFNVGTSALTGPACSPNTIHWAYDTWMLSRVTTTTLVQKGGDSWFFIRADYAFGRALQSDAEGFIGKAGGHVLGSVAMPFPSTDFAAALLQAQASGAKVIGLANAGDDLVSCIKQAAEFGITQHGQRLAALLMFINNVHSLGLQSAQGLLLTESFYWDMNDRTRSFSQRAIGAGFDPAMRPNMSQAACYSGTRHYLRAVAQLGAAEGKRSGAAVVARMKRMPIEDDIYDHATIRADGRVLSPAYLFQVKRPEESHGLWDYYKTLATVAPEQAWRPVAEGGCPLVRT